MNFVCLSRYYNLEVRDRYFSRLKAAIEFNLEINEKKTVLVSHSMGSTVLLVRFIFPLVPINIVFELTHKSCLYTVVLQVGLLPSARLLIEVNMLTFHDLRRWVESPHYGRGGPDWVDKHVSDWVNIAGTLLGVPKAMAALVSGEMRGE